VREVRSVARVAAWTVLLAGGFWFFAAYASDWLADAGLRHTGDAAAVLGVAAVGGAAAWYGYFRDDETPKWFVALGILWALCGLLVYSGYASRDGGLIADYCAYGAVSKAQLDGCIEHVDEDEILGRNTNAARFARRDIEDCFIEDSGPFCLDYLNRRLLNDQREPD
jgi:hypothetical protein